MDQKLYPQFGTDGVRGTYGENLDENFVYCLGIAIARVLGTDKEFIIGRDTRSSGESLAIALIKGLESSGAKAKYISILSTPGIATIAHMQNARACAITASHNPANDNGVKVFDVGGKKILAEDEQKIELELETLLTQSQFEQSNLDPEIISYEQDYISFLDSSINGSSLEGLSVVLDCANGASSIIAPKVFERHNANVIAINTETDGININNNCGATHLESLQKKVIETKADIGFAFDGDADRVIVVDDKGTIRDGDFILALFALEMKRENTLKSNAIAVTSMSNGALNMFLNDNHINVHITDVGDKYVLEEINNSDLSLGGEQSGHIIRTDVATWGDGIANALLVSKYLLDSGKKSSELFNFYTPMVQLHEKVKVTNKNNAKENNQLSVIIQDELAKMQEGSRIIVRPSGTEDVVRISVESFDENIAKNAVSNIIEVVKEVCK